MLLGTEAGNRIRQAQHWASFAAVYEKSLLADIKQDEYWALMESCAGTPSSRVHADAVLARLGIIPGEVRKHIRIFGAPVDEWMRRLES